MADPRRPALSGLALLAAAVLGLWWGIARLPGILWPAAAPAVRTDIAPLAQLAGRPLFAGGLPIDMRLESLRHDGDAWQAELRSPHLPPIDELRPLVRRSREAGWEAHATAFGSTGAELRLYADGLLVMRAEVHPDRRPLQRAEPGPTLRHRPLLALVVHNLGDDDAARLIEVPLPLGLAILPYRPHSLRLARGAVQAGHEVILELPKAEASSPEARAQALAAIPWVSGVLVTGPPPASLPALPFGVLLSDAGVEAHQRAANAGYRAIDVIVGADPMAGLAEAQRRALSDGGATLVVDAKHGGLRDVLDWAAHQAETDGFRLALPAELARMDEVVGQVALTDAPPPEMRTVQRPAEGPAAPADVPPADVPPASPPSRAPPPPTPLPSPARPAPSPMRDLGALELDPD